MLKKAKSLESGNASSSSLSILAHLTKLKYYLNLGGCMHGDIIKYQGQKNKAPCTHSKPHPIYRVKLNNGSKSALAFAIPAVASMPPVIQAHLKTQEKWHIVFLLWGTTSPLCFQVDVSWQWPLGSKQLAPWEASMLNMLNHYFMQAWKYYDGSGGDWVQVQLGVMQKHGDRSCALSDTAKARCRFGLP